MTTVEPKTKYFGATGRRKTSVSRVRITPATKQSIEINGKPLETYFVTAELQAIALDAFTKSKIVK